VQVFVAKKLMPSEPTLAPEDQSTLAAALDRLLADGLLWRGHEPDLRAYNTLARWRDLAAAQLGSKGWELIHHDSLEAFQVVHRKGKHRRPLSRETALGLLVARLLRAETPAGLTPHPVVTIATLQRRCADFSFDLNLSDCLPELEALKLIRAAGGKTLRPTDPDQLLELLPTLDLAAPDSAIEELAGQLRPEHTANSNEV
jgi:hypothetical protein